MLIIQYPRLGDTDTKYCELVATTSNMLSSCRSKPKCKALVVDSDGELDELDLHLVQKSKPLPILFSTFHPPRLNAWNPPLVNHGFIHTTAVYQEDGTVNFSVSETDEEIEIAGDWQVGQ